MQQLQQMMEPWFPIMFLILASVTLIMLIVIILQGIKLSRLKERYLKFMNGMDNKNMEQLLIRHMETINDTSEKVKELQEVLKKINVRLEGSIQKVGMVRYSAFEDIGSDLSFAFALLDEKDNGVMVNGIFGRNSTYTYAKPILEGKSTYKLSEEEAEALHRAQKAYIERQGIH